MICHAFAQGPSKRPAVNQPTIMQVTGSQHRRRTRHVRPLNGTIQAPHCVACIGSRLLLVHPTQHHDELQFPASPRLSVYSSRCKSSFVRAGKNLFRLYTVSETFSVYIRSRQHKHFLSLKAGWFSPDGIQGMLVSQWRRTSTSPTHPFNPWRLGLVC